MRQSECFGNAPEEMETAKRILSGMANPGRCDVSFCELDKGIIILTIRFFVSTKSSLAKGFVNGCKQSNMLRSPPKS